MGKQQLVCTVYGGEWELLTSTEDTVTCWKDYYKELLNPIHMYSGQEADLQDNLCIVRARVAGISQ